MILDDLPSLLALIGLMLAGVGMFLGFIAWWLRRELRGER